MGVSRAVYVPTQSAKRIWKRSWIYEEAHIQICVRNPAKHHRGLARRPRWTVRQRLKLKVKVAGVTTAEFIASIADFGSRHDSRGVPEFPRPFRYRVPSGKLTSKYKR